MATYDPLGLISPALLSARQFGQRIVKHSWNEKLDPEMEEEWGKIFGEVVDRDVKVKRRCHVEENSELHVFCDASGDGYGAAVYLRTPGETPETTLLFAKSRVTPTTETKKAEDPKKKISISRMELLWGWPSCPCREAMSAGFSAVGTYWNSPISCFTIVSRRPCTK